MAAITGLLRFSIVGKRHSSNFIIPNERDQPSHQYQPRVCPRPLLEQSLGILDSLLILQKD